MKKPNLFDWATSELSQDAFICWLLSWANYPEDEALYKTAKHFINMMTGGKIQSFDKVTVIKQTNNIDVLCLVDDKAAIIIEDKIDTVEHSNQLARYKEKIASENNDLELFLVFYKTGDQGCYGEVEKQGYMKFLRKQILEMLYFGVEQGVEHPIFADYFDSLLRTEKRYQSYLTSKPENWSWDAVKGFFGHLQKNFGGDWGYVPQMNGGFMGYWWHWKRMFTPSGTEFDIYLQIEHKKFCFKVAPIKTDMDKQSFKNNCYEIRDYARKILFDKAGDYDLPIKRNGRIGRTMTIAMMEPRERFIHCNEHGLIDLDATTEYIAKTMKMLDVIQLENKAMN